jgi:hypothetical protein
MQNANPIPGVHTCISFEEFSGHRAKIEEFRKFLSGFKREQVVLATCVVNAFLGSWGGSIDADGHDALIGDAFFSDDAVKLLEACRRNTDRRFVFHRQQALFVAKEAILHCNENGIDPLSAPYWAGLGLAFLMANDLMAAELPDQGDRPDEILSLMSHLITVGEFSGRYVIGNRVARSHLMLTKFFPSVATDKLNILDEFRKHTSLDLEVFIAVCMAIISFYLTHNFEVLKTKPGVIMHDPFWAKVKIDKSVLAVCLGELSGTIDEIRSEFMKRNRGLFDMTGFRSRPLVRHSGGGLYAPDIQFVIQKLESAIFWRVHDVLSSKDVLHRLWGEAFEHYVNWMISETVGLSDFLCVRRVSFTPHSD